MATNFLTKVSANRQRTQGEHSGRFYDQSVQQQRFLCCCSCTGHFRFLYRAASSAKYQCYYWSLCFRTDDCSQTNNTRGYSARPPIQQQPSCSCSFPRSFPLWLPCHLLSFFCLRFPCHLLSFLPQPLSSSLSPTQPKRELSTENSHH